MSAAESSAVLAVTPKSALPRWVRLLRVGALLIVGLTIAFSATMHEQLGFDLGVSAAALGAIGIAHLIEWYVRRSTEPSVLPLLLGVVAVLGAVLVGVSNSVVGFALVIAAWSLVSALLEFIGAAVRPGSRQDPMLLGAAGMLLALFVLLVREDQVAVLGFFGGYAMIAGVFLGIAAFDRGPGRSETDVAAEQPVVAAG